MPSAGERGAFGVGAHRRRNKRCSIWSAATRSNGTKLAALAILAISASGRSAPPEVVRALLTFGGGLLGIGLLAHRPLLQGIPREVALYFSFVVWATATAFVADDRVTALETAVRLIQVGVLLWAVVEAHRREPDIRIAMTGLWGIGVVWGLVLWLKPETGEALARGRRLSVLGENPNTGGQILLFALLGGLYLLQRATDTRVRLALLSSLPVFGGLLLQTGSRKMLLAMGVLGASWVLVSGKEALKRPGRRVLFLIVLLGLVGVAAGTVSRWEGSPMAARIDDVVDPREGRSAFGGRDSLYELGWELFLENPIAGVGLMNQAVITGRVFHSDYIDVLASTGLVGALLYFSVYVASFLRARRSLHTSRTSMETEWQAFAVYLVVLAWLMAGYQRYDDLYTIFVLGSFVGFFLGVRERERRLSQRSRPGKKEGWSEASIWAKGAKR